MELFLNLVWVLLALPGYWLWRRAVDTRRASSRQCLLALGCALVLLFPVISATDDLHAMRAEMEESSTSKRAVRPAAERHSAWVNRLQGPAGFVVSAFLFSALEVGHLQVSTAHLPPLARGQVWHVGRAPPVSLLG
jgi:hypothetical protein